MAAEDLGHLRAVRRTASCSRDYFGGFPKVRWAHDRRGYDRELFRILVAKIIEAVQCTSGDAQRLPGSYLDGRAVNRPSRTPSIP